MYLDEGTLPADQREERRDGSFSLALLLKRLKEHLARGPAGGAGHVAETVATPDVHRPPEAHLHVVVRRERHQRPSIRVPAKVGTGRVGVAAGRFEKPGGRAVFATRPVSIGALAVLPLWLRASW